MSDPIAIHAADGSWRPAFERAAVRLTATLGPGVRVEHVGSTAVAGLSGKPILDIMLGVGSRADIPKIVRSLEALGFLTGASAPSQQAGAFLSREADELEPPINLHLTVIDGRQWRDLLRFRDELRANPRLARAYEDLKRHLAATSDGDLEAYTAGKTLFITDVLKAPHG